MASRTTARGSVAMSVSSTTDARMPPRSRFPASAVQTAMTTRPMAMLMTNGRARMATWMFAADQARTTSAMGKTSG